MFSNSILSIIFSLAAVTVIGKAVGAGEKVQNRKRFSGFVILRRDKSGGDRSLFVLAAA